jgi:hypothetical protein
MGKSDKVLMLSVSVAMAVYLPRLSDGSVVRVFSCASSRCEDPQRYRKNERRDHATTPRALGSEVCPASWRRGRQGIDLLTPNKCKTFDACKTRHGDCRR